MRYAFMILIVIGLIGCSEKDVEVADKVSTLTNVNKKVNKVVDTIKEKPVEKKGSIEVVESASIDDKTLVADERKVEKRIQSDVPARCNMWSDGCNVCTRNGNSKKALCTVYPACHNRMVSCLEWN